MNRFDSFAPLRVNVAAQWLVDGVSQLLLHLFSSEQFERGASLGNGSIADE